MTLRYHFDAYRQTAIDDLKSTIELEKWRRHVPFSHFMCGLNGWTVEVGCGQGELAKMVSDEHKVNVIGLDLSIDYLKSAKKSNLLEDVIVGVIEYLPFRGGSLDTVIADSVLEHVQNIESDVKNLYSVLKSNGKLFVQVPYNEDTSKYSLDHGVIQHLRSFNDVNIHELFNTKRTEIIEMNRANAYDLLSQIKAKDNITSSIIHFIYKLIYWGIYKKPFILKHFFSERVRSYMTSKLLSTFKLEKPKIILIESVKR